MVDDLEQDDTLEVAGEAKSSARVLSAIKKAERAFYGWQDYCDEIDRIYAREETSQVVWADPDFDLFWASTEILKPAIYANPPVPVVSPQFKDRRELMNVTSEMLERTVISAFDRTDLDEAMACVRDDLIFYNRGQLWVTLEEQKVCVDHVDRKDFLHPPARKWSEVPWVARRAWLTKSEMRKRFRKTSGDAYQDAVMCKQTATNDYDSSADHTKKAGVWEVWHKADNKVYWVTDGVRVMLDEGEPHLKLTGFFPCPRPAYGTIRPRTLEPVPDYRRYSGHFRKINQLTKRIYVLLDQVRMKGLLAAGGDVADAVEQLIAEDRDDMLLIPVPGAALISSGGINSSVQWLPLRDIAEAIQGLIAARTQLIEDFYQLSGISDIMRGATEAEETLGAQRLKSQFGSVRVREKIEELQRIAADITRISAEVMAENFTKDTLLEMSQMEIPSKSEISKRIKEIEKEAQEELRALKNKAQEALQSPQAQEVDPAVAQQEFVQAQSEIVSRYAPLLQHESARTPIEDVMALLRDDKARHFAFEIATDSTIMTDELAEKQSRNEFMEVFTSSSQALIGLASMGEEGAKLSGELLKFVLAPYRVGRELNGVIDEFIDAAPRLAKESKEDGGDGLAEAQMALANAEAEKAKAQMAKVQADASLKQADLQTKMQQMQMEFQERGAKLELENGKLQLQAKKQEQEFAAKMADLDAKQNLMQAQTAEILNKIGLDVRKQDLEEYQADEATQERQIDRAIGERDKAVENQYRDRGEYRSDRQQEFSERAAMEDRDR